MSENRADHRVSSLTVPSTDVEWCVDTNFSQHGRILDLDKNGTYIDTPHPCPKGSRITMRFHKGTEIIEVSGLVVHQTPGVDGMGVSFADLSPEEVAAIEALFAVRKK